MEAPGMVEKNEGAEIAGAVCTEVQMELKRNAEDGVQMLSGRYYVEALTSGGICAGFMPVGRCPSKRCTVPSVALLELVCK